MQEQGQPQEGLSQQGQPQQREQGRGQPQQEGQEQGHQLKELRRQGQPQHDAHLEALLGTKPGEGLLICGAKKGSENMNALAVGVLQTTLVSMLGLFC